LPYHTDGQATIRCSSAGLANNDVTATEIDDDFTLAVSNDGNGTTSPSGATVVDQDDSPYQVSATASAGYTFANWTLVSGTASFSDANAATTDVTASADAEIQHGMKLLREIDDWDGPVAVVEIDPVCKWDHGAGRCGRPLARIVIVLRAKERSVDAVAYCEHHAECMETAVQRWRDMA